MKRVILDSSVCIDVVRGRIPRPDWDSLRTNLQRRSSYFVSPLTFIELIVGLGRGEESHYHKNLKALNVLCAPGDRFLKFPGHFILDRVFGDPKQKAGFEPHDFNSWALVLLNAANKKQLTEGTVDLLQLSQEYTFGFNFNVIIESQRAGIAEHVRIYESIQKRQVVRPTPEQWATAFLFAHNINPTLNNCKKISASLDAANRLHDFLCDLALNSSYNFAKHPGDWVDGQQLYYLADPKLYLLTMDRPLRARIRASPQANRVLNPQEFIDLG